MIMALDAMTVGQGRMPSVGLGLWKIPREQTAATVEEAIKAGYRHFDCASDYGNEAEVGQGLRRVFQSGMVARNDLWITSKLWNTYHRREHVRPACERTLRDLGLDHLDLYLIHFPIALKYVDFETRYPAGWMEETGDGKAAMEPDAVPLAETWAAMEDLVRAGLVREIGVCNYNTALLHDLMANARIKPSMLQVECHPYLTQERLLRTARQYGLAVTAFSPLGALSYLELQMAESGESVLQEPVVQNIADRLNRSPAQIVLRWGVQRGTAVVPKTNRPERLRENLALFDFELTEEDMLALSGLNRNRRFNDPGVFCEKAFGCFHPIFD
jgi:D-xylose reductase